MRLYFHPTKNVPQDSEQ